MDEDERFPCRCVPCRTERPTPAPQAINESGLCAPCFMRNQCRQPTGLQPITGDQLFELGMIDDFQRRCMQSYDLDLLHRVRGRY